MEQRPHHLLASDRPCEHLVRYSAANIYNAELMAIIWRTGFPGKAGERALTPLAT